MDGPDCQFGAHRVCCVVVLDRVVALRCRWGAIVLVVAGASIALSAPAASSHQSSAVTVLGPTFSQSGHISAQPPTTLSLPTAVVSARKRSHGVSVADAHLAGSLASTICTLLNKPVSVAINRLIAVLSHDRIKTTVAGTLISEIGVDPLCEVGVRKIESVVKGILHKPATSRQIRIRSVVGPFVSDVTPEFSPANGVLKAYVQWRQYDPFGGGLSYYLWLSVNHAPYYRVSNPAPLYFPTEKLQFAVQLRDAAGHYSPVAYSTEYETH
jgi:hypothetical protein